MVEGVLYNQIKYVCIKEDEMKKSRKTKYIKISMILALVFATLVVCMQVQTEAYEKSKTKIHFISLYGTTDAILLESDGHFGMVDSGEDWDYPNSEKYPLREGVTTGEGFEQQVIHYLHTIGVKKLDFYIATHSHSDHIGSGDEILNHFPVDRLYIGRYDDSYMLDSHGKDPQDTYYYAEANENYLWDNQYVYDCLIKAANDNNVQIITDLDLEKNAKYRNFKMGQMNISIMNYERERDANENIIPTQSENNNALAVLVRAYGKNAFLTSDIAPMDGDTRKIADQLVEKLWTVAGIEDKNAKKIENRNYNIEYDIENYEENPVSMLGEQGAMKAEDEESQPNYGRKIQLDLMKMAHHGVDYNNTTYFLTSLNPKTVVITGPESWYNDRMKRCMPNTKVYSTVTDSAAVIAEFSTSGMDTKYQKISAMSEKIDGETHWFDENGRTISGWKYSNGWYYYNQKGVMQTGWQEINGSRYYMNESGVMQTGWQYIDGIWYYFHKSGSIQTGWQYINNAWYFLDSSGAMQTGWQQIGGNWYYLDSSGAMRTGWQYIKNVWYYMNESGIMQTDWQYIDRNWYYLDGTGAMRTGWQQIGGNWYFLDSSGAMRTGWHYINENWYFCESSGKMIKNCWCWIGTNCYYFKNNGVMAVNTWIGDYYVNANGAWESNKIKPKDEWINQSGRWWYRHADGSYTKSGWENIAGARYYFDAAGWMVIGWKLENQNWYYLNQSGAMVKNTWYGINSKCYYFDESGKMAVDTWIGEWYVDESGAWVPEK